MINKIIEKILKQNHAVCPFCKNTNWSVAPDLFCEHLDIEKSKLNYTGGRKKYVFIFKETTRII